MPHFHKFQFGSYGLSQHGKPAIRGPTKRRIYSRFDRARDSSQSLEVTPTYLLADTDSQNEDKIVSEDVRNRAVKGIG